MQVARLVTSPRCPALARSRFCPFSSRSSSSSSSASSSAPHSENVYDVAVIGAGIVGLASARELLLRYPSARVVVLEKEHDVAQHQTGHNSGVVHMGMYYKPGSLKAKLCVEGAELAYKYMDEKKIPYRKCGKLIVATKPSEVPILDSIYERGLQNNIKDLKIVGPEEIRKIEPVTSGIKAIYSPRTGIVDWAVVAREYAKDVIGSGGEIRKNFNVAKLASQQNGVFIRSENGQVLTAKYTIACAGLYADRLAAMSGHSKHPVIIPFRGEFWKLKKEKEHLLNGLVYPVPDVRFPFLGIHLTKRIDGSVWIGPSAVLAFSREGYQFGNIRLRDLWESLSYSGLRKLLLKYPAHVARELAASAFSSLAVPMMQALMPSLTLRDLDAERPLPAGVRAQALSPQGDLVDDFLFEVDRTDGTSNAGRPRILHVRNSPSPAATASLAIAKEIIQKATNDLNWASESFAQLSNTTPDQMRF